MAIDYYEDSNEEHDDYECDYCDDYGQELLCDRKKR